MPNPYLGVVVIALLIGRIVYSLAFNALSGSSPFGPGTSGGASFQQAYDPVSGTVLFLFIGYYVTYYAGLLIQSRRLSRDSDEP